MAAPTFPHNRRADDYSDDFLEATFEPLRWSDIGAPSPGYGVNAGRAETLVGATGDHMRLRNLVTLPARTDASADLDLDLWLEVRKTGVLTAGGQEYKAGLAVDFSDSTTRRRLCIREVHGSTPVVRVENEAGTQLGSTLTLNGTNPETFYVRATRSGTNAYRWHARKLPADAWTQLHSETISAVSLTWCELFAQRIAGSAFGMVIDHDWIRRVVGVPPIGSTLDVSYAGGTIVDDHFLDILDRVKPSGLKIVINE